ncbi:MAG TPA: phosphoribosyltransferase family protein [bacterium]|nr:phosphoribosyltransferase family protein [bacterium]
MIFMDRRDAGRQLADALMRRTLEHATILGLARGGVVVAREVARALHSPFDVVVVRKIGAPGNEEFAIGAVGEDGAATLDADTIAALTIPTTYVDDAIGRAREVIRRRAALYRRDGPPELRGRTAVLVDDGIATGHTMEAAIETVRRWGAVRVVVAVPVAAQDTARRLRGLVDELVVLSEPAHFMAVGQFYRLFPQVSDDDVQDALGMPAGTAREAGPQPA